MPTSLCERRFANSSKEDADELLHLLLQSTDLGICRMDMDGRCTFINRSGAAMLGYAPDELLGRELHPITHHTRADGSPYAVEDCPIRRSLRVGRGIRLENEVFWRQDGSSFAVEYSSFPLVNARGAVLTFQDITDRKEREKQLYAINAALENAVEGISLLDPQGRYLSVNRAYAEMLGCRPEEMLRSSWMNTVHPEDRGQVRATYDQMLCSGKAEVEARGIRKDGSILYMHTVLVKAYGRNGDFAGHHCFMKEVTEKRELEEQLRQSQKMEAVGQLAGGIAHDFNNLMTIVVGYSDLWLDTPRPDDGGQEFVEEIKKAGERAANLTRQLLMFSKRQVLEPRVLDLNEVVFETEKMLRRVIGEDIELITRLPAGLDSVRADPGHLQQVILNLAVNARDAMPQGGKLTIETRNVELGSDFAGVRPGCYVMLSVTDTGVGMSEHVKQHIFEPFFTTKEQGKGTGLGLPVVHGVIKQSDGHIDIQSALGAGTSVRIYLPRAVAPPEAERCSHAPSSFPRGCETILLVEDEEAVRRLSRSILLERGYTVLEAPHGDEALEVSAQYDGPIQLLITDVVMPSMGGRVLAERLLVSRPEMKALYVSGYMEDAVVRHGVAEDEVAFLAKPYSPAALAQKVREVLDATDHRQPALAALEVHRFGCV